MEADVLNALETQSAYLIGGHDRDDRLLIIVPVPFEVQDEKQTKKHLELSLKYIVASLSENSKTSGFVVIIDAQKCPWRVARNHMKNVIALLDEYLERLIILRTEAFWDKQRVENCAKGFKNGEPIIISKSRLSKYFDPTELPEEFNGTITYNHTQWLQNRLRFEEFKKLYEATNLDLENLHFTFLDYKLNCVNETKNIPENFSIKKDEMQRRIFTLIETGKKLINDINRPSSKSTQNPNTTSPPSQDLLDATDTIKRLLADIDMKQKQLIVAWNDLERSLDDARELSLLKEGVQFVTNWILGTGESVLNQQRKVGYDVQTAEDLRNKHEELELYCWETYGFYAKLLYKINKFTDDHNSKLIKSIEQPQKDLISQRDFMDFVCRSYAARLERRRNVLITSLRFYRLVSEYFDKTNDVFKSLVMGQKADNFELANDNLIKLRDSQSYLDKIEKELIKEGEKLSDMLAMPVKDALGCDIKIDYSDDIANVRDILDATIARRNIFVDSIELQKLTLEQITHVYMYEQDAEIAIKWIEDLYNVMIKLHTHVGCNVYEIQMQKDELQNFQETAKGIFDYCCQILAAALALRQLCKLSNDQNSEMSEKLHRIYKNLDIISQEQMTRLRVSAVFHRSVEDQCIKLDSLRNSVITMNEIDDDLEQKKLNLKKYLTCREKLLVEIGRMVRLGRLLKTRLKESFLFHHNNNHQEIIDDDDHLILQSSSSSRHNDELNSNAGCGDGTASTISSSSTSTSTTVTTNLPKNIVPSNTVACDAITEKLNRVSKLAENLDHVLKDTQMEYEKDELNACRAEKKSDELGTVEDWNSCPKSSKSSTEDESFITASDFTITPQSRSSSFHTASESPWWEHDPTNSFDADSLDLDSQLPSLNLFNGILSSTTISFDDSEHSSLSIEKSPVYSESTDLDEAKKSSTDNLSSDSTASSKDQKTLEDLQSSSDAESVKVKTNINDELIADSASSADAILNNFDEHLNSNHNHIWASYYQNFIAKQAIIKGCI